MDSDGINRPRYLASSTYLHVDDIRGSGGGVGGLGSAARLQSPQ